MSEVSAVNSSSSPSLSSALGGNTAMGKDDFLTLLVTQLQNQDPLSPEDPTEFTAQLAQFSSLEQQFTMNANLEKMAASSVDIERLSALNLIGKEVVSEGGSFELGDGPVELGYRVNQAVKDVALHVYDEQGELVASVSVEEVEPGDHFVNWDGLDSAGNPLPAGRYSLSAAAGSGEAALGLPSLVRGNVTGVDLGPTGSILVTNAGSFNMFDIGSVREI